VIRELLESSITRLFGLAFISNCIPYMTIPYLVVIAPYLARIRGVELVVSILALALGATLGKLVVYGVSRGISHVSKIRIRLRGLTQAVDTYRKATFLAVFLAAASPIPDDVVYIPVGISGYSVAYFFMALFLGKLVITILTVIYGAVVVRILEKVEVGDYVYVLTMITLTLIAIYITNKINWNEVNRVHREKGVKSAIIYIVGSVKNIVTSAILRIIACFKGTKY
jgi:membrane protein DedA with SNARE-associated domain